MARAVIITPTYNRGYNGLLLKSMLSVSRQNYGDFLHLVVDDGSTDNTRQVVEQLSESDPRIIYERRERTPNQKFGASVASNYGIRIVMEEPEFSEVEYVTFLHSDDMLNENSIRKRVETMEGYDDLMMVYGYLAICGPDMSYKYTLKGPKLSNPEMILRSLRKRGVDFPNHTLMIRKNILERIKGFDENLGFAEDKDFSIRVLEGAESDQFLCIPEVLSFYRLHNESVTGIYTKEDLVEGDLRYLESKNGASETEAEFSSLCRFLRRPYSFLPEKVKKYLRPVRDEIRRQISGNMHDPFIEKIEREAESIFDAIYPRIATQT